MVMRKTYCALVDEEERGGHRRRDAEHFCARQLSCLVLPQLDVAVGVDDIVIVQDVICEDESFELLTISMMYQRLVHLL